MHTDRFGKANVCAKMMFGCFLPVPGCSALGRNHFAEWQWDGAPLVILPSGLLLNYKYDRQALKPLLSSWHLPERVSSMVHFNHPLSLTSSFIWGDEQRLL